MAALPPPVVEVGVGTGAFAQALGVQVGLDPARAVLLRARARGLQALRGVAEALPFREGSLGGVLVVVTICFVDRPQAMLGEIRRALAPHGGLVVGMVPADSPWGRHYRRLREAGHPFYRHATFYTVAQVVAMADECGLGLADAASTLTSPPGGPIAPEAPRRGVHPGASFVALLFRPR